jgi:hypothetical protein
MKRLILAMVAIAPLAACQVDDEAEPELENIEGLGLPPPIPECGQQVFWLGEHSTILTPWYDPGAGQAGAEWSGSIAPEGQIAVRGATAVGFFPFGCTLDVCVVFEHSGWHGVVSGWFNAAPPGFEFAEFYFNLWGQERHCYVHGFGGPV